MTIVFYISGHGFGHASRDIEVINTIGRRRPDAKILVRTSVPRWFFEASLRVPVELQSADVDTGLVQIDSLRLDEDETARRAARFYSEFDRRVEAEAAVLRTTRASVVVGDVPPLAFAASRRAGLPSLALANFTWDWIYAANPRFEQLAPGVLALIRVAYGDTTRALRLPLHGGFDPMASVTRDIPLVARRASHERDDTRRALELGKGPVVLASFGAYGAQLPYAQIALDAPFTLVATDHEIAETGSVAPPRLRRFTNRALTDRGFRYEDLVRAADVVVTKPGYGIVSECIANDVALLYTSRGRFAEHDMFVAEMPRVLRCRYLPQEDLLAGRWANGVTAVLGQPAPPERFDINGAEVAATEILEMASWRVRSL